MKQKCVPIVENTRIAQSIYRVVVRDAELAALTKPGQFYELKVSDTFDPILRRPISIGDVVGDTLVFYYKVVGRGTELLSRFQIGQELDILGPLGNTFPVPEGMTALVGGGIGIAPLVYLARQLQQESRPFVFFAGLRTAEEDYLDDLRGMIGEHNVRLFTDDGTKGTKGFAAHGLFDALAQFDTVMTCGPSIMMKCITERVVTEKKKIYVSLEENMGCGVGVCLGCVVRTQSGYQLVCKDGPVFSGSDIVWQI